MTNIGQIKNSQVLVEPSQRFRDYIQSIKVISDDIPIGIQNIIYKNKPKDKPVAKQPKLEYLVTEQDNKFIESLKLSNETEIFNKDYLKKKSSSSTGVRLLSLQDLHWLYAHIQTQNENLDEKIYLHELLEGSEIVLPKNEEIPRNEELEKRCQKLKAEQENRDYQNMTKNVDNFRKRLPEDTIGYQMKMMNTHLIAVFQFIVSVITGFAFGFIGIELLIGTLDFGFRLLLGIVCALIIALAELYFLAKKLNEDLEFETMAKKAQPIRGMDKKNQ
ncbi:unnamed protein product [Ceutorhynchus assimilis]|uniref:Transmembrane protein 199 n=1 Tax=Ceutorhynchus assimilis TaxID=467358 RepID=A0A9N9MN59_9CUCU|nr:unnamed protein product [Ceutorhynchus assimilis]